MIDSTQHKTLLCCVGYKTRLSFMQIHWVWALSQIRHEELKCPLSSFMSFTNVLDWSRTGSGLHSIIPEHIRTCTRVSQATSAEYQQKYFTTMALCLQIIPVRWPLVSSGEGPEQWYDFKSLSWPNPGLPGKKPQSPGFSVKIWFLHFFGLSGKLPMLCALYTCLFFGVYSISGSWIKSVL